MGREVAEKLIEQRQEDNPELLLEGEGRGSKCHGFELVEERQEVEMELLEEEVLVSGSRSKKHKKDRRKKGLSAGPSKGFP